MAKFLNEKKFEHICGNGTQFTADRCDFRGGILAEVPKGISRKELMQDVSEMIAYHALNIFNQLNGFSGYDCIKYEIKEKRE